MERSYVSIDLKSFFASVECVERGLDPLTTNLVVADSSRTEKTICLAVTPSLKSYGISGRARLFEVVQRVGEINAARRRRAPGGTFTGKSYSDPELKKNSALELDYIVAKPQMSHYIEMSTKIYDIYMKYVAPEDVHVYSIDEVFIDLTAYLKTYGLTARELTQRIILDVLRSTGITATAGIGTNLYLSKIAMDIVAKHIEPDADGVRIAELTEQSYREQLWEHRPLTDFWRVGRGYAKKLEAHGMYTMGDVALRACGPDLAADGHGAVTGQIVNVLGDEAFLPDEHIGVGRLRAAVDIFFHQRPRHGKGCDRDDEKPHELQPQRRVEHGGNERGERTHGKPDRDETCGQPLNDQKDHDQTDPDGRHGEGDPGNDHRKTSCASGGNMRCGNALP